MPWAVPTLTVSTCTGGPCLLQKGWGAVKSHRVPTGRAAWTLVTKHPGEWEGTRPMGLREPEGLGCLGPLAHVPVAGQLVGQLEELDQVLPQRVSVCTLPEGHAARVEEKGLGRGESAFCVGLVGAAPSSVPSLPACSSQGPRQSQAPLPPTPPQERRRLHSESSRSPSIFLLMEISTCCTRQRDLNRPASPGVPLAVREQGPGGAGKADPGPEGTGPHAAAAHTG